MKKGVLLLIIVLLVAVAVYAATKNRVVAPSEEVACTLDAKLCPDGSSVGRVLPSCEFAPCPEVQDSGWAVSGDIAYKMQLSEMNGIVFTHPNILTTRYITVQNRPPTITPTDTPITCPVPERIINGTSYCVETTTEGAAGSIYTDYTYSKFYADEGKSVSIKFTTRAVQCANYEDPQKTECEQERESFDIDKIADDIFNSMEFEQP